MPTTYSADCAAGQPTSSVVPTQDFAAFIISWVMAREPGKPVSIDEIRELREIKQLCHHRNALILAEARYCRANPGSDPAPAVLAIVSALSDNSQGWCYLSQATLGEVLGRSRQSINAAVGRLERDGAVIVDDTLKTHRMRIAAPVILASVKPAQIVVALTARTRRMAQPRDMSGSPDMSQPMCQTSALDVSWPTDRREELKERLVIEDLRGSRVAEPIIGNCKNEAEHQQIVPVHGELLPMASDENVTLQRVATLLSAGYSPEVAKRAIASTLAAMEGCVIRDQVAYIKKVLPAKLREGQHAAEEDAERQRVLAARSEIAIAHEQRVSERKLAALDAGIAANASRAKDRQPAAPKATAGNKLWGLDETGRLRFHVDATLVTIRDLWVKGIDANRILAELPDVTPEHAYNAVQEVAERYQPKPSRYGSIAHKTPSVKVVIDKAIAHLQGKLKTPEEEAEEQQRKEVTHAFEAVQRQEEEEKRQREERIEADRQRRLEAQDRAIKRNGFTREEWNKMDIYSRCRLEDNELAIMREEQEAKAS